MDPNILSITDKILSVKTADMSADLVLLHRTKSSNADRMFRSVSVSLDDEMKKMLIENTKKTFKAVKKNAYSITEFSDPADHNSYVEMTLGVLPKLNALLDELKRGTGYHGSSNFDELNKKGIGCLILKSGGRRIFAFFNVSKNHLRPDKYIITSLSRERLTLHDGKIIVLEKNVFAVYYEDLEKLLITSYRSAKKLLGFNEQFKSVCSLILDAKLDELVTFEGADHRAFLGNMATNEKMVKMDSRGAFEGVTRKVLEVWNQFYKKTPLEETNLIKLNKDGKAVISNHKDLKMLLRVLNSEIVEPVTDRRSYALAPSKKPLRVSRRQVRTPGGPAT